ncbi:hypothetical protein SOVF_117280 [Spinacia oleracea]|nr:hypothetical protein SOVF_117280 [Spinacia oleracea]
MKPSKLSCEAPLVHEWKRVIIGDEFKHEATTMVSSMVRDTEDRVPCSSSARRKLNTHNNEDTIRVIMFLGPWSHT